MVPPRWRSGILAQTVPAPQSVRIGLHGIERVHLKLARWMLSFYRLPYVKEVRWSNAIEREGVFALLELESDDGVRGVAEGTVKATWQGVSPRSLAASLEDLVIPLVQPLDLADERAVPVALAKIPENRLAKTLVDNACWTMRAAA